MGVAIPVAAAAGIDPQSLELALNDSAEAILAWSRTGEPRVGIEASRFANGRWTAVETLRAGLAPRPTVGIDSCGNAIVVWSESEGRGMRVFANRFDAGCR